jgi:hypothetical protein
MARIPSRQHGAFIFFCLVHVVKISKKEHYVSVCQHKKKKNNNQKLIDMVEIVKLSKK